MELLYKLKDDQYPLTEIKETRACARGIVLNENNEVLMIHCLGDDIFGHRDYYETPGGGVEPHEDLIESVVREVQEETGYITKVIQEIGYVDDYYNLINRHNLNYYFLLKIVGKGETNRDKYEEKLFESFSFHSIDEAISLMENTKDEPLAILIKRRELPIYKLVKEILDK